MKSRTTNIRTLFIAMVASLMFTCVVSVVMCSLMLLAAMKIYTIDYLFWGCLGLLITQMALYGALRSTYCDYVRTVTLGKGR